MKSKIGVTTTLIRFAVRQGPFYAPKALIIMAETKIPSEYNEDSIRSLDWKEHIRLRPGMYIGKLGDGSAPDDGIYVLMKEVIDMDVAMINDIFALQKPNAIDLIKKTNVGICLMHMQGTPRTMQLNPNYKNVVNDVKSF